MLKLAVLAKQVPDTKHVVGNFMKEDGTLNRAALPAVFNPEDLNALELALRIKDRTGGSVSIITMGPPAAATSPPGPLPPGRRVHWYCSRTRASTHWLARLSASVMRNRVVPTAKMVLYSRVPKGVSPRLTCTM